MAPATSVSAPAAWLRARPEVPAGQVGLEVHRPDLAREAAPAQEVAEAVEEVAVAAAAEAVVAEAVFEVVAQEAEAQEAVPAAVAGFSAKPSIACGSVFTIAMRIRPSRPSRIRLRAINFRS